MYIIEEISLKSSLIGIKSNTNSIVVQEIGDTYKTVSRFLKEPDFKFKLRNLETRETVYINGLDALKRLHASVGILGTVKQPNNKHKFNRITLAEYELTTCLDYVGWYLHREVTLTGRDLDKTSTKYYFIQDSKDKDYLFFEYIGSVESSSIVNNFFASYIYNVLCDKATDCNRLVIDGDSLYIGTFTADTSHFVPKYQQSGYFVYRILDRKLFDSLVARYSLMR